MDSLQTLKIDIEPQITLFNLPPSSSSSSLAFFAKFTLHDSDSFLVVNHDGRCPSETHNFSVRRVSSFSPLCIVPEYTSPCWIMVQTELLNLGLGLVHLDGVVQALMSNVNHYSNLYHGARAQVTFHTRINRITRRPIQYYPFALSANFLQYTPPIRAEPLSYSFPGSRQEETLDNYRQAADELLAEWLETLDRVKTDDHEALKDMTCSICLEDIINKTTSNTEELTPTATPAPVRLACKHIFHEGCLVPWLDKSDACPLCRAAIE